jgi:6-phosphogluconolactonase (cycloisomerase 2 family)
MNPTQAIFPSRTRARRVPSAVASCALLACLAVVPTTHGQAAGRAIFIANNGNLEGSVTAFAVNADGTLTFVDRVITGTRPDLNTPCPGCNPYEISISPSGRYLATGHASTNDPYEQITVFEVASDVSITQIGAFSVPGTPMDVVWINDELLAATRTDTQKVVTYHFDPAEPSLTEVAVKDAGTFNTYLAVHPSRQFLYVNDSGTDTIRVFNIAFNGALTLIDSEPTGSYYNLELALTHDGTKLYAAGGITQVELGFNVASDGTLTPMSGSPFPAVGQSPSNLAAGTDDHYLLVGHGTDATLRSFTINQSTGGLTYTGNMFDVGLQGTLGDVQTLDNLFFVTDNSTAIDDKMGVYSFTLNANGSFTQHGDIVSTGGIAPRTIAVWKPRPPLGDLNCDGAVNAFDIDPFVLALTDPVGYVVTYRGCEILNGDIDCDAWVTPFDIDPFVECLTGGCPPCP